MAIGTKRPKKNRIRIAPEYKICAKISCRRKGIPLFVETEFNRNAQNADGIHSYCKECRRDSRRESIQRKKQLLLTGAHTCKK